MLDEHRYGLLPVIRRVWGRRGVRVHVPYATRYQWGYLHEAMEVNGANKLELLGQSPNLASQAMGAALRAADALAGAFRLPSAVGGKLHRSGGVCGHLLQGN